MGTCRVALFALVLRAGAGCNNDYPLAPTPCDDYCLATQRADCEEDWPSECVKTCEILRSPDYPTCTAEFETALACYETLDDSDFECVAGHSQVRPGVCESELRAHALCVEPVFYRCLFMCEDRAERCPDFDVHVCVRGCRSYPKECEDEKIRVLDCELANTSACSRSCTSLDWELSLCGAGIN